MTPEQMKWGLLGLLVGDALGVPYEFTKPKDMPPLKDIEYEPPPGFQKAWPNVPAGTWSDDGSQALCVLDALQNASAEERIEEAVGKRLLDWYQNGFMAVDKRVFDIGNTTREALHRLIGGVLATASGMKGERTHANGSLMRTLPVAFLHPAADDEVVRAAMGQSRVTHAEAIPMLCCAFYCLWARHIATGAYTSSESWNLAFDALHRVVPKGILTANIMFIQQWRGPVAGSGYCVDSLHSAKQALEVGTDYESVVKHAISLGNDTDTTACIVGGLAGIKYQTLPQRWLDGLRGKEILNPVLAGLEAWKPSTIS
jgi:ADP-ribosyl-[dinitrogen reductase] hydrolase